MKKVVQGVEDVSGKFNYFVRVDITAGRWTDCPLFHLMSQSNDTVVTPILSYLLVPHHSGFICITLYVRVSGKSLLEREVKKA